ncbi:hypothetical protein [Halorussus sp. AFM4]|uniref:hypothetical protein n=1 Tax=Halorussus sp. AFM4 TaxID=3421651 RepID=UPI003EBBD002
MKQQTPDQTLQIDMDAGARIVDAEGITIENKNESHVGLTAENFSLTYTATSPMTGITYTHSTNYVFAPTPDFGGADVALKPKNNGFIGQNLLYLGNYSMHSARAGCHNISVIKPEDAEFNVGERLTMLTAAARTLEVGHAYTSVYVFASPEDLGARDGFVIEYENEVFLYGAAPVNKARNTWLHEYIHTRQAAYLAEGENFAWFAEGSANYYAARLALDLGLITPQQYDARLASWASYTPTSLLRNAKREDVAYRHGAVVLAELDAQLNENGYATLLDIFEELNRGYSADYDQFESLLAREGRLNETQLNQTKSIVWEEAPPQPQQAYMASEAGLLRRVQKIMLGLGVMLFGFGLSKFIVARSDFLQEIR